MGDRRLLRPKPTHPSPERDVYRLIKAVENDEAGGLSPMMPRADTEAWDPDRDIDWDWVRSLEDRGSERVE